MANSCFYSMKVTGKEENVNTLIKMLAWKDEFEKNGLGRTYSVYEDEESRTKLNDDLVSTNLSGDCAWSVVTSMCKEYRGEAHSLESVSEQLDLVIEVFSEENNEGFQEHILIAKGESVINDSVDYEEHCVTECETLEEYNEENDTDFTEDMVVDGEYVYVGGFGDKYCDFQDHMKYFNQLEEVGV